MYRTITTIHRAACAVLAAGLMTVAPAAAASIDSAPTPRPAGDIVVPQQILDLAPAGTPVLTAATRPRIRWSTAPRLHVAGQRRSCRTRHAAGRGRCRARHRARAAGDYGVHFLNPDAVCSNAAVTFDYRDFWVSSISSGTELIMVQDYAFYWDGRAWKQYAADGIGWAWSGYQLATGWSAAGPNGTVVAATLGENVRFATARGAAIKIVQGIAWLDGRGTVISTSYRALDHRNPGWFDYASHPFCQY